MSPNWGNISRFKQHWESPSLRGPGRYALFTVETSDCHPEESFFYHQADANQLTCKDAALAIMLNAYISSS